MELYWFEQSVADLPADDSWLTPAERAVQTRWTIAKRRSDWRLGRWTAKGAVASLVGPSRVEEIEIRAADSGAPEAFLAGQRAHVTISISHRDGSACCAAVRGAAALGCDLEVVEPRSAAFIEDYFTDPEQRLIASSDPAYRDTVVALLWSAKESALKALGTGLRAATRSVEVAGFRVAGPFTGGWTCLEAVHPAGVLKGWWRVDGNCVRTVVSTPHASVPLSAVKVN